ncbi:MAG: FAD-dependent oxidoreductase [Candidatus Omnitrophota bacterium]
MQEFRAQFLERIERTKTVVSFRFKPEKDVDFTAGQFVQFFLKESDKTDKSLNKYLSFSCAPGKEYIEVTKRISESDFSKRLLSLKKNDSILLKGPLGHCVLDPAFQKVAFLIGGIGITPVISILEQVADKKIKVDALLLYSNMRDDDIAFKHELDAWAKENANIRVLYMVVSCVVDNSRCFEGMITKDFVLQQMPDYKERAFYLFGPPAMVSAMKAICQDIGCDMGKIKTESFIGY